jgi:diguanylate cyclase (GGDEF)-like protein/PAS domain S-box-containing protein
MEDINYKTAVDAIAIYTETDLNGMIIHVNQLFCDISGYSKEELIGQNHRILNSGCHSREFFEEMWLTISTGNIWRGDICNRAKNGSLYWVASAIMPLMDSQTGLPVKYLSIRFDISDRYALQVMLEFQAQHDVLTGLANRHLLQHRLEQLILETDQEGKQLALCFVDLDGFKGINDKLGHGAGDQLLKLVSQRLSGSVKSSDLVARLGGDEFVILLTQVSNQKDARLVMDRILATLARPYSLSGESVEISGSAGLTIYPHDNVNTDTLLRHADQALYQAKQTGRNRCVIFDVVKDTNTSANFQVLANVSKALRSGELLLYYQPKLNMRAGNVVGFEALLRWLHPTDGLVPPMSFLPLLEESELIIDIGEWVIDQALDQLEEWTKDGKSWSISVNIAAHHFHQENFVERLRYILHKHPSVDPRCLDLEVLESVAMRDISQVQKTMKECQALGVTFSLDDFGTGFSSLSYLKYLPTETLKIDKAFIHDILNDADDLALTEAIIALSSVFNRSVIAEGVELPEHGVLLLRLGCDVAQGYGIARPMPASEVIAWSELYTPDPSWKYWSQINWELRDFPLLVAQHDHLQWIRKVIMAVEGEKLDLIEAEVTDHHQCRLGKWYYSDGTQRYGNLNEFKVLEDIHKDVHRVGTEILFLMNSNQYESARQKCSELLQLKSMILKQLDVLSAAVNHTQES